MNFPQTFCGMQRISASGPIGDSGKAVIICGYALDSGSGGVALPTFYNGTSSSAAVAFKADNSQGAASGSRTIALPVPVMLGNGCYVNFDSNTAAITVFYIEGA